VRLDIHPGASCSSSPSLARSTSSSLTRSRCLADGGVKRLRLYGRPHSQYPDWSALAPLPAPGASSSSTSSAVVNGTSASSSSPKGVPKIPAVPLTPSAFAPYGSVIQSYPDERSAPKEIKIKTVNFGTARKFNHLAPVAFTHPGTAGVPQGEVNFCVFRSEAQDGTGRDAQTGKRTWEIKVLERHEWSSQAFVPMGGSEDDKYLVLVALPGPGASSLSLSSLSSSPFFLTVVSMLLPWRIER